MSDIHHRNSVRLEAREKGKLVASHAVPTNSPGQVYKFLQNALGALSAAMQRNHTVVICVCPKWKAWILQNVLRCTK